LDNVVPARTKCLLFRSWHRWSRLRCVQTSGNTIPSAALIVCSLCSGRLCFFPLTATTIVSSVVSSAATALQLLLWSDTLSRWVSIPASHTPRCIAAVTLRVSEADKLSSYLNKEVTVRFGKLKMQLWDSMCWPHVNPVPSTAVGKDCQRRLLSRPRFVRACFSTDFFILFNLNGIFCI
jgi:hypothetical protein